MNCSLLSPEKASSLARPASQTFESSEEYFCGEGSIGAGNSSGKDVRGVEGSRKDLASRVLLAVQRNIHKGDNRAESGARCAQCRGNVANITRHDTDLCCYKFYYLI